MEKLKTSPTVRESEGALTEIVCADNFPDNKQKQAVSKTRLLLISRGSSSTIKDFLAFKFFDEYKIMLVI